MNTFIMSTAVPPPFREHTGQFSVNATCEIVPAIAGIAGTRVSATRSAEKIRVFFIFVNPQACPQGPAEGISPFESGGSQTPYYYRGVQALRHTQNRTSTGAQSTD